MTEEEKKFKELTDEYQSILSNKEIIAYEMELRKLKGKRIEIDGQTYRKEIPPKEMNEILEKKQPINVKKKPTNEFVAILSGGESLIGNGSYRMQYSIGEIKSIITGVDSEQEQTSEEEPDIGEINKYAQISSKKCNKEISDLKKYLIESESSILSNIGEKFGIKEPTESQVQPTRDIKDKEQPADDVEPEL